MKKTLSRQVFNILNIVFMLLFCAVILYPYLNQIALSFNEGLDAMKGGITIWPRKFTVQNYRSVFANSDFLSATKISITRVILCTVFSLLVQYCAAYGLTRKGVHYRKGITLFLMIPSYISAGIIPQYMTMRAYGLMNNYLIYILPGLFSFYNMVIFRSFLQDIPGSLEESAKMDGANDLIIAFKIIFPLSMPVVATVTLWNAVGAWNDWTTTLLYVTEKELFPLQYLMMKIIKESEVAQKMAQEAAMNGQTSGNLVITPDTVKAATLIVTTLPIIAIYPFLQKYFIKGVTLGAVKE